MAEAMHPAQLSEQAKEARRAYKRNWNKAHPDKVKSYQQRYWERIAAAAAEDQEAAK